MLGDLSSKIIKYYLPPGGSEYPVCSLASMKRFF